MHDPWTWTMVWGLSEGVGSATWRGLRGKNGTTHSIINKIYSLIKAGPGWKQVANGATGSFLGCSSTNEWDRRCVCFQGRLDLVLIQRSGIQEPSLPTGDTFRDAQQMPETRDSTKPYIHYVFSYTYIHTHIPMTKLTYKLGTRLTIIANHKVKQL